MLTATMAQGQVASLIKRRGSTVTLADGCTTKCIFDANQTTATRYASTELLESGGRLALFHFTPGTKAKAGDAVTYKGERWSLHAPNNVDSEDVPVTQMFVAKSGASGR